NHPPEASNGAAAEFQPYRRNEDGARPWAIPGTRGLEHRIGGLEKEDVTGNVSYDAANHQAMVNNRAAKIAGIRPAGASFYWTGPEHGDLLLLGWGGTHGAIKSASLDLRKQGVAASACQLRYLNPLPEQLASLLKRFKRVLIP